MPSLEPAADTNTVGDGSPTFSEVLSLSSPDLPEPGGTAAQATTPAETDQRTDAAATPDPEEPSPASVGPAGSRAHRRTGPSGPREREGRGGSGPPAQADGTAKAGTVTPSAPASMQDGSSDVETEQSAATALMAAGTSSAVPAPAADAPAVVGNERPRPPPSWRWRERGRRHPVRRRVAALDGGGARRTRPVEGPPVERRTLEPRSVGRNIVGGDRPGGIRRVGP